MRVAVESCNGDAGDAGDESMTARLGPAGRLVIKYPTMIGHHATNLRPSSSVQSFTKFFTNVPSRSARYTAPPNTEFLPPPT